MSITSQIKDKQDEIVKAERFIDQLREVEARFGHLPEMEDVQFVSVYDTHDTDPKSDYPLCITFGLRYDRKDSKLPHALAQFLGVKFDKKPSAWQDALELDAVIKVDGQRDVKYSITNYLPPYCKVEKTTVDLPEAEWEIKTVKTKTVRKIVCGGGKVGEPETVELLPEIAKADEEVPF